MPKTLVYSKVSKELSKTATENKQAKRTPDLRDVHLAVVTDLPACRCASCLRKGVAQGGKVEHAPTAASTPGAEGKKGVSWGTVKTHKVYVIDSDGGDDGKEVKAHYPGSYETYFVVGYINWFRVYSTQ